MIRGYIDLAAEIRARPPRLGPIRLVAVDGPGGSGKSTFARRLARALDGATIVETDDFASWDVPLGWWDRLEEEVLRPLADGRPVRFRRYDWQRRAPGAWREPRASDTMILEGVSSARLAVADRLTAAIWVEAPRTLRLARGLERDGEAMRGQWLRWMAEEDAHFATDRTRERADLRVDTASDRPHDPEREFVALD